jgi:hypothetical protein
VPSGKLDEFFGEVQLLLSCGLAVAVLHLLENDKGDDDEADATDDHAVAFANGFAGSHLSGVFLDAVDARRCATESALRCDLSA